STSTYFPDRVVPMLPEVLSNGLCSINPHVDRLCMLCEMEITPKGKLGRTRFHEAVMRSHARLTYTQVAAMLVDGDKALSKQFNKVLPHLKDLHSLYKVLAKSRRRRGAIDFETTETRFEFDDSGAVKDIVPIVRNEAHKLIEECMITANIAAARFLEKHKMPALFRVHGGPAPDKLEALNLFLAEAGLSLGGGDKPTPKDYANLLKEARQRPDAHVIQTVLLRSLKQAMYQPANEGHFGLALDQYAHFTSPIRRYPDLLVHRAIRHVLGGGKPAQYEYSQIEMEKHGHHCSINERRADEASWDVVEVLKCEYLRDHTEDEFDGVIGGVNNFGLFVELDDMDISGLIHVTSLGHDYFHHDAIHHRLVGEHSGVTFRIGETIRVRVIRVAVDERKIDLEPVNLPKKLNTARPMRSKSRSKSSRRRGRRR
ncbi:MAG: VacB/RNase II family 3'-5' exoribonuclease, partial [Gammaproteobacteria bacterium]|nr:VacB/RNase II family 3'-5' exoribonuclease [Gammaproteobacteria bacterium]